MTERPEASSLEGVARSDFDRPPEDDGSDGRPWNALGAMTLLIEAARDPLDPAYSAAAERRRGRESTGGVLVLVLIAALTMGTVWAARELRAPAPAVLEARMLLEEEITERSAALRELQDENAALAAEVGTLAQDALAPGDPALLEAARLGPVVGTEEVSGPGIALTLRDSARADPGDAAAQERVQYVDLQLVVNALWRSGAEAIAVNGHRLTSLSAIRFAGQAILIELTPLSGPYRVEAVGEPEALRSAFTGTSAYAHLLRLRETFGIGVELALVGRMELTAVSVPALRVAQAPDPD